MGDLKKWTVTYTKHVKQKRKIYQDGLLHLLSNKVMLYDECEQLLESKFVTKAEAVRSGGSLTFAAFLVEVGDPINDCDSVFTPSVKPECDKQSREKSQMPQEEKLRNTFANRKPQIAGRKASSTSLSPSQKMIRDFKKNEALRYGAHQSPTSPATSSFKEWEALYTTQITQKAKKYHDGFIRMIICGSQGRQAILYDSNKSQIDKRFLKRDEVISSGESLMFDAHLVDIGDPIGTNEDDADVKTQGNNNNTPEKSDFLAGRHSKKLFSDNVASHAERSKKSTQKDHVGFGNSVMKAQPQDYACSNKSVSSRVKSFGFDTRNHTRQPACHTFLRDASQILSILRKPTTQETISNVGDDAVEQCIPQSSESVQLDDDGQPRQASDGSLQVDQCQVITGVEKHTDEKAANGGNCRLHSEGSGSPSKASKADLSTPPVNTNCSSNDMERLVSTKGAEVLKSTVSEYPCKSQSTDGSSIRENSIVLRSSEGFVGCNSPLNSKTATTNQTKLSETNPENKEEKGSTLRMSRPKWFGNLGFLKTKKDVKIEKSEVTDNCPSSDVTNDCPSFDLGI